MSKFMITIRGETHSLGEWADIAGISRAVIYRRYNEGVRGELLLEPVRQYHPPNGETLCLHCQRFASGCSWSRDFIPVKGWDATPSIIGGQYCVKGKQYYKAIETYIVNKCPEFLQDEPRHKKKG